ncbi:MAG: hypothetical protein IKD53_05000 [Clostridia bacterium]|nr:hypothetical protein [Clostridia bacterium]
MRISPCPDGVEIGGVLYADRFTEYRPLFDAEIIPCREHNYRLIYGYDLSAAPLGLDAEASGTQNDGTAAAPGEGGKAQAEASVSSSVSILSASPPETESAVSPAAFHRGDVLEGGFEVLDDAVTGGMNRVWHVRHADTGAELAMVQPLRHSPNVADTPAGRRFVDAHALWQGIDAHPQCRGLPQRPDASGRPDRLLRVDQWSKPEGVHTGRIAL